MDLTTMHLACAATDRVVERITADQLDRSTPCSAWDVRALLGHVVGTLHLGAALLTDDEIPFGMAPGGLPDTDLPDGDPLKAYRAGVESLLAAADTAALARPHVTPFGEMPGAALAGFTTADIAVHGWDLARAMGQPSPLGDDLADTVLAFARQTVTPETRAPRIGPELPAAAGAPSTDRLAAFFGRRP